MKYEFISHNIIVSKPNHAFLDLTSFLYCNSPTYGTISCLISNAKLFVRMCTFYNCTTKKTGAAISTNSPLVFECSVIGNCKANHSCAFYSEATAKTRLLSINRCKSYTSVITNNGNDNQLFNSNFSKLFIDFQSAAFISRDKKKCNVKYITICDTYDNNGCTLTFYYSESASLLYANVFNSSSRSYSLLLFGFGVKARISNCVFSACNKSLLDYFQRNHEEEIIFTNCTFDLEKETEVDASFTDCTTISITFVADPTFITPETSLISHCQIIPTICDQQFIHLFHFVLKYSQFLFIISL